MKATVFPFTWLPEPDLQVLADHFYRPTVLAASDRDVERHLSEWHEAGRIELQIPFQGDAQRLAALRGDFQRWAETHRGVDRSIAQILEESIPFYDDSHVAKIRSQIRRKTSGDRDASLDRLTRARLFLQMAEHYDRQRRELETDLKAFNALETAMLSDLRDMEEEIRPWAESAPAEPPDPGRFMTEERLRAWARLYLDAELAQSTPAVFATTSKAALETMLDAVSAPDRWMAAEISGGGEALAAAVSSLAAEKPVPPPETPATGPMLSLFYLPEQAPRSLFSRLLGTEAAPGAGAGSPQGTAFVWVQTTD